MDEAENPKPVEPKRMKDLRQLNNRPPSGTNIAEYIMECPEWLDSTE
jgi:hypothetical protein